MLNRGQSQYKMRGRMMREMKRHVRRQSASKSTRQPRSSLSSRLSRADAFTNTSHNSSHRDAAYAAGSLRVLLVLLSLTLLGTWLGISFAPIGWLMVVPSGVAWLIYQRQANGSSRLLEQATKAYRSNEGLAAEHSALSQPEEKLQYEEEAQLEQRRQYDAYIEAIFQKEQELQELEKQIRQGPQS